MNVSGLVVAVLSYYHVHVATWYYYGHETHFFMQKKKENAHIIYK